MIKKFEDFKLNEGREYYEVSGIYEDDPDQTFSFVVTNYDDVESNSPYDVNLFGYEESDIKDAIETGDPVDGVYIIKDYQKL